MMIHRPRRSLLAIAFVLLQGCRQDGSTPSADLHVADAWARATAPGQDTGGVFLTVHGRGAPDRLVGGSTTASATVQIHTMRMDGAVMRMRPQDGVDIPANGLVKLEPGGTHLMLVGLKAPLTSGRSFKLTLDFRHAGTEEVEVEILPITASGPREAQDE